MVCLWLYYDYRILKCLTQYEAKYLNQVGFKGEYKEDVLGNVVPGYIYQAYGNLTLLGGAEAEGENSETNEEPQDGDDSTYFDGLYE